MRVIYPPSLKLVKNYNWAYCVLVFIVLLLIGFRPIRADKDSEMYLEYYKQICNFSYTEIIFQNPHRIKEVGYLLLNKLFCTVGFRGFLIVVSALSVLPKAIAIYRYSANPFIALFFYCCLFLLLRDFTQMRDAVAVSFAIWSLLFFYEKKIFLSAISLVLAISFHLVALSVIPVLGVLYFFKSEKYYFFLIFICLLLTSINFFDIIKYDVPMPYELSKYNDIRGGGSYSIIVFGILTAIEYKFFQEGKIKSRSYFYRLTLIGIAFGFLFGAHPVLFRIASFLMFFSVLLGSNLSLSVTQRIFFAIKTCVSLLFFVKCIYIGLLKI